MKTFRTRYGRPVGFTKRTKEKYFNYVLSCIGDTGLDAREKAFTVTNEFEKSEVALANRALDLGYSI